MNKPGPTWVKGKRIWDNYKVIGEVRKSTSIKLVVAAGMRDGVQYINIREFYIRKRDGVWMPGRDGITVPVRIPVDRAASIVETFIAFDELLHKAVEELSTMPLEDPENAVWSDK